MPATRLSICLARVLEHEGGYVNDPHDPGGATNKGVTIAVFRAYRPGATIEDLKRITDADLQMIYRFRYWAPCRCDDLPIGVDYAVFDFAVNSGVDRASRYLQRVVGATEDGKIGPQTIAKVNARFVPTVVEQLCQARLNFLRGLPTFARFGRGWTARISGVETKALEDIAA